MRDDLTEASWKAWLLRQGLASKDISVHVTALVLLQGYSVLVVIYVLVSSILQMCLTGSERFAAPG